MESREVRGQKSKIKSRKSKLRPHVPLNFDFCVLTFDFSLCLLLAAFCLLLTSCRVGPEYSRPPAPAPQAYKEMPPAGSPQAAEWAPAQPSDAIVRGKWWEVYNDPELNALEEQVSVSNQNLLAAEAQFREAKFAVKIARANLYPTVSVSPSIVNSRASITGTGGNQSFTPTIRTTYDLPFSVSYEPDVWGNIRRSIQASAEAAQVSDAELENA